MNGTLPKRSVYVAADALADTPDYARRLVEESGVDCFVLRAGFDPASANTHLGRATEQARTLGAQCWFLVGTWWGHGMDPGSDAMTPVADDLVRNPAPSHEGQWRMASPGGPADDVVERSLRDLCRRLSPDGICLTHARYRHPAAVSGMFEIGGSGFRERMRESGIEVEDLRSGLQRASEALTRIEAAELLDQARISRLPNFLDTLAETDVFSRWFELRADIVIRSLQRFRQAVKSEAESTRFGTNAFGPIAALECGQDYNQLVRHCDFVQPLLGYVYWHVLQPVDAWRIFLAERSRDLSPRDAEAASAALFGLAGIPLDLGSRRPERSDEGAPDMVRAVVERQLQLLEDAGLPLEMFLPVLRGRDWPATLVESLTERADRQGYGGAVYQGTAALASPVPSEGWS